MRAGSIIGILIFCCVNVYAQEKDIHETDKVLPAEKVVLLIPDKIRGFEQTRDTRSSLIQMGTLRYSMCEKTFTKGVGRSIKILLFDYKEAPIMYTQATRRWNNFNPIENDSIIIDKILMANCAGWEAYNKELKNSQVFLGVCDRFFLQLTGQNIDLEVLKEVIQSFEFDKFPK
ncbi:MAG: hypothetical protein ACOYXT_07655 [Bacteroidota bacterium]